VFQIGLDLIHSCLCVGAVVIVNARTGLHFHIPHLQSNNRICEGGQWMEGFAFAKQAL